MSNSSVEIENFEKSYYEIVAEILSKNKSESQSDDQSIHSIAQNSQQGLVSNVRFPQINLPVFSGHYHERMELHDTFQSLIHNNSSLDNIQRFYYLKYCLKGEASNVIKSLEVSSSNYAVAWVLLNERFENKRLISSSHIKSILEFSIITKESASALRLISDDLNKHVRCLESLGSKLDQGTRREWEQFNIQGVYPIFQEFSTFLEKRCDLLEAMQANNVSKLESRETKQPMHFNKFKRETNNIRAHHSTIDTVCIFCNESHIIYNCPEFLKLSISSRGSEIKKRNLCFNCLRNNHVVKNYRATACRKCNKRHHTLLHFESPSANLNNNPASSIVQSE